MASKGQKRKGLAAVPQSRDFHILIIFALIGLIILCALCYNMIIKGAEYSEMAEDQHFHDTTDVARRGTIYDRNGEVIASSIESVTIDVNPHDIDYSISVTDEEKAQLEDPAKAVAQLLSEYLGETYGKTYHDYYDMVTTENTSYVIIQRKCDSQIAADLEAALDEAKLVGVYYEEDSTRIYPNGTTGSQIIGAVDIDGVGIAGLEYQYDDILKGTDGKISQETSASGIPIAGGAYIVEEAVDGEDMITSLDIKLQQKVEESLLSGVQEYSAQGGSAIVMDASTGEIYAACSYVRTESEEPAEQVWSDELGEYVEIDNATYDFDAGKMWGITDSYEPGSTFKVLTALSLITNNGVTPESNFFVPSKLDVYDTTVTDSHDHDDETISFDQIIAESSNIGTVNASYESDSDTLYSTYNALGIGQKTGVDFPGEAEGQLEETADWDGVQRATITFGQGVATTGIQMVRAYAAIEQRGTMRTPHFVTSLPGSEELNEEYIEPLLGSSTVADASACESIISMMRSVVTYGTGTYAAIDGYNVVGKTGTAEVAGTSGSYEEGAYIVSFCGWLDGSDCDLVCLVTMERPRTEEGGGPVCGPIFADIMSFAADRYHADANQG